MIDGVGSFAKRRSEATLIEVLFFRRTEALGGLPEKDFGWNPQRAIGTHASSAPILLRQFLARFQRGSKIGAPGRT